MKIEMEVKGMMGKTKGWEMHRWVLGGQKEEKKWLGIYERKE